MPPSGRQRARTNAAVAVAALIILLLWLALVYRTEPVRALLRAPRPTLSWDEWLARVKTGDVLLARGSGATSALHCALLATPVKHVAIVIVIDDGVVHDDVYTKPAAAAAAAAEKRAGRQVLLWESGVGVGTRVRPLVHYLEHGGVSLLLWRAVDVSARDARAVMTSPAYTHYGYSFRVASEFFRRTLRVPLLTAPAAADRGVGGASGGALNCSDLAAHAYVGMGVLDASATQRSVFPRDFLDDRALPWRADVGAPHEIQLDGG